MLHLDVACLLVAERETVPAQPEFDRIAERRAAEHLNVRAVTETHLKQTTFELSIAANLDDPPTAACAHAIQFAGFDSPGVRTAGVIASFFGHIPILSQLRFSFNYRADCMDLGSANSSGAGS